MEKCPHALGHSDAAKRCADNVNYWYQVGGWENTGKWVAIALADGSSDHALYDTKAQAVSHQSNEFLHVYVKTIPMAMGICEAQTFLDVHRKMYDAGFRLADPDRTPIVRGRPVETVNHMIRQLRK